LKEIRTIDEMDLSKYYLEITRNFYFLYYKTPKFHACIDLSDPDTGSMFKPQYVKGISRFLYMINIEFVESAGRFYEFNTKKEAIDYANKSKLKDKLLR
jgi:hypothetical protein